MLKTKKTIQKFVLFYSKDLKIKLYQYEACPFSHKVRAYLKFKKLNFETVEVNPFSKKELDFRFGNLNSKFLISKDYKKVPVAIINDVQINNSYDIIKYVDNQLGEGEKDNTKRDAWNEFVDRKLAVTLLPNLYKNYADALEAFDYISKVPNWNYLQRLWLKYFGAFFMRMLKKRLMKKHQLKGNDPRTSLYELIDNINFDEPFLTGNKISDSDVVVYGVFTTVSKLKTGRDIFNHNSKLKEWYQRVEKEIN
jgi:microsomal prostaglandin-E synthase 2